MKKTKQNPEERLAAAQQKKKKRSFWRLMIMTMVLFAGAVVIMQFVDQATRDKNGRVMAGDDAPGFALVDLYGEKQHSMDEYKGKGLLLNFWGTFCEPCKKEMPLINDNYQMMQDQGVNFVAVNVGETPVRVSSFIKDIGGTDYPILMDTNSSVEKAYGIYNLPVTFIINKKGEVVEKYEGEIDQAKLEEMVKKANQ
ncbi:redoxin domain-containing protein [Exiguobacterium acetylicum]|uniref:redoxin domain-containing protein n=1 Tax=Exiguobacterium TaxID=33986 RepID=UPI0004461444|nr:MULTISPECIES: redoxin domain-containing protein [Exiguobacterium]EZP61762.1 Alkyl hydroperoxide reductase [Exiguobacterium sp. RIT341]KQS44873.1 alkyl hydroperoxide reductase [Exiguobacterium sp. Leaf196]MDQ6466196.1 redoxin domain-containing protein [Exiguobacterium acetylicum]